MRPRKSAAVVFAICLMLGSAACGEDDVKAAKFESELLKTIPDLTKAQAACLTDKTYDTFDQGEINKLYRAENEEDVPKDVRDQFDALTAECASGG